MTRRPVTPPQTKSDRMRTLFAEGKTISEVARLTQSNYAFVYGVAKRAGLAQTLAGRRPEVGGREAKVLRWIGLPEAEIVRLISDFTAGKAYSTRPATRRTKSA